MLGTSLGHYRIVEKIGEGGMGVVYLADDLRLKRRVVLKVLPDVVAADPARRQRLVREARAAAALEHPHVCAIHDVDEVEGRTFIAMEYVRGRSLRHLIQSHSLSLSIALDLAVQIADGLAAAHESGIVHRDLKPENVLVSDSGYAKIIDFGLALGDRPRPGGDATTLTAATGVADDRIAGTMTYMSPEQARGEVVDARSDIFSFGVVLYEMLTGASPFHRGSAVETLSAILTEPAPPMSLSTTSVRLEELQRIVRKALVKDRQARYQSIKDLALDLGEVRAALNARTVDTVASTRRRRRLMVAAVTGALALATAGAWYRLTNRGGGEPGVGASGRPAVAVMTFDNPSGASDIAWLARGVPTMLLTGLAQARGLDVVSSNRLDEVVRTAGYGDLERVEKSRWRDVARRAGAGALVTGSVFKVGDQLRLDVSVEDASTGRVLSAQSVRGSDVFPLVDDLTARIVREMRVSEPGAVRPIADVTSSSLDAYRLYSEALEARKNLRQIDARALFEKAVAIDPAFASAYAELAVVAEQLRDPASAQKYRKLVWKHQDRLPPRGRLLLQLQTARADGDSRKAVAIGERLVAEYPDETEGFHMLAHAYMDVGATEKGLEAWRAAIRVSPEAGELYNEYGYTLISAGRYNEGLAQLEEYRRLRPREPNPYDSLGESQLVLGQPERALDLYATALTINPGFDSAHIGRVWAFAVLGRYPEALAEAATLIDGRVRANVPTAGARLITADLLSRVGRYREASMEIDRARREATAVADLEGQAAAAVLIAVIALERARTADALRLATAALPLVPRLSDRSRGVTRAALQLLAGTAEARSANVGAARTRLAAERGLLNRTNRSEVWLHHALEGEIALNAGQPAAATAAFALDEPRKMWFSLGWGPLLSFVNTLSLRDGEARAKVAADDVTGAIQSYKELLTPSRDQKWIAPLEPRFVLALAQALERTDRAAARAEYERFLQLWEKADPDLPELAAARRQVAR